MNYTGLNESINATFTALQAALGQQSDAVLHEIGSAAADDQTERRDWLTDKAKKLRTVEDLVFQAVQGYVEFCRSPAPAPAPAPSAVEPTSMIEKNEREPHHKSRREKLDVIFQDKRYHDPEATDTFVKVIEAIGIDRVADLQLTAYNREFVSRQRYPRNENGYPAMRPVGEYFVITTFSTEDMEEKLLTIKSKLGLSLEAKVVPDYEPSLDIF